MLIVQGPARDRVSLLHWQTAWNAFTYAFVSLESFTGLGLPFRAKRANFTRNLANQDKRTEPPPPSSHIVSSYAFWDRKLNFPMGSPKVMQSNERCPRCTCPRSNFSHSIPARYHIVAFLNQNESQIVLRLGFSRLLFSMTLSYSVSMGNMRDRFKKFQNYYCGAMSLHENTLERGFIINSSILDTPEHRGQSRKVICEANGLWAMALAPSFPVTSGGISGTGQYTMSFLPRFFHANPLSETF